LSEMTSGMPPGGSCSTSWWEISPRPRLQARPRPRARSKRTARWAYFSSVLIAAAASTWEETAWDVSAAIPDGYGWATDKT
jgi:hypothetical protein